MGLMCNISPLYDEMDALGDHIKHKKSSVAVADEWRFGAAKRLASALRLMKLSEKQYKNALEEYERADHVRLVDLRELEEMQRLLRRYRALLNRLDPVFPRKDSIQAQRAKETLS